MQKKNQTVLSKKTVYKAKYFTVNELQVKMNNLVFTKSIIQRKPAVLILPITPQNELFLVSQYREAQEKISLEVVSGFIEDNEDPREAAKRELKEETGLTAKDLQELITWELSANMKAKVHVFIAQNLQRGKQQLDPDEQITVIKLPLKQAVEKITTGKINVAPHAAAILLLDNLQRNGKIKNE